MPATPPESPYKWAPIAADLHARIGSGEFPPGSLLPSTADIQRTYRVGGHTARAALHDLIDKGLAQAHRARGTIVTAYAADHDAPPPPRTHSARRLAPSEAPSTGAEDLTARRTHPPREQIPPGDVALKLDTERTTVTRDVLTDATGRTVALRTVYDTQRAGQANTILTHTSARTATPDEARTLEANGTPLLLCQDETHTTNRPLYLVRTLYRADQVRLSDQYRPE